jgi:dihydrofolate reductase
VGKLVYGAIASLDGYTNDASGKFDWAAPDAEVHAYVNELERSVGTYLYGRRMYETMRYWETAPTGGADGSQVEHNYARIWQAAEKVVFSSTLGSVATARTRLERVFDVDAVRTLLARTEGEMGIGGPTLAATALRAGLVESFWLVQVPVVIGGGTPVWPADLRLDLDLVDERRFAGGAVFLRYRAARG